MPLTDLIRYFNVADTAGESTLYPDGKRAAAWHRGLRLSSLFQPIVDLRQERVVGHQAVLLVRREDGTTASAAEAYAACETSESVVHFDRLCRTLHALNFLAQKQYAGGYLQLSVHPRHLLAVQNQHGLVYEAILKRCGLAQEDIVLHIDISAIGGQARLVNALASYRQRGYRLALAGPSPALTINELLDLARIEARQGVDLKFTDIELNDLVRRTVADLATNLEKLTVQLDLPAGASHVRGDEAKLRQALINILGNACKYSQAGGEIRVAIVRREKRVGIEVTDHGIGMTPEQIRRLGERFFRVMGTDQPGSGLGWSIVTRMARLYGLTLSPARSPELGGLRVTVSWALA